MSIKEFVKSLSIYGVLPVFTKFAGFLLVPIYVRVLSQYDYGIVELILSTISFLTYLMNLEFYAAVGRFYFDRDDFKAKQRLVSTGMQLTIASIIVVVILFHFTKTYIHQALFNSGNYSLELQMGLLWAAISAISTYLSILPRYEKKAGRFVLFNIITLIVKLTSTIVFVVIAKLGIKGVLLGHIAGAMTSCILYGLFAMKYLKLEFSYREAKEIIRFSLPLFPGVILIGVYQPLMRTLIARVYDVNTLAIFSFAIRISTILVIVSTGIRLAWRPMLYENLNKKSFGIQYGKISSFAASALLMLGIATISFSREIVALIGTSQYFDSVKILGFIIIGNILWNLDSLRGFGFEVAKKTYWIPIISGTSRLLGVIFLVFVSPKFGLMGIGIAMSLPQLIDYIVKVYYTKLLIKSPSIGISELILWVCIIVSAYLGVVNAALSIRMFLPLISGLVLLLIYYNSGKRLLLQLMKKKTT